MSTDNKDRALNEYLAGSSPVSRSYQDIGYPEPSPELDHAVLAEARRAGRARAYSRSRVRWNTWFVAATVAATVALSIALVLEVTTFSPMYEDMVAMEPSPTEAPSLLQTVAGDDSKELAEEEPPPARERKATLDKTKTEYRDLPAERANIPDAKSPGVAVSPAAPSLAAIRQEAIAGKRSDEVEKDAGEELASIDRPVEGSASIAERDEGATANMLGALAREAPHAAGAGGRIQAAKSSDSLAYQAPADTDTVPGYPAPDVWLAGIRYLQARGETERAVEELKKFQTIYPDYRPANTGE